MALLSIIGLPTGYEWIIILAVVLLIFGPKNLPKLGRMFGTSLREFRSAASKVTDDAEEKDTDGGKEKLDEERRETASTSAPRENEKAT